MKDRHGRVALVAVAACLALSAAACGSSRGPVGEADEPPVDPTPTATPVQPEDDTDAPEPAIAAGVFAGEDHGCAALPGGGLLCWGRNGGGQLGDGTDDDRDVPVEVLNLKQVVVSGDAGGRHTCVVTSGGVLACWGANGDGQLGDGTGNRSLEPLFLSSGWLAVGAGKRHTCGVDAQGGVSCWGENEHGQLGDGTDDDRDTPVPVLGLSSGMIAVGGGNDFTCALSTTGTVACWGDNDDGQLGDGTEDDSEVPVAVAGLAGATAIGVGEKHACAITAAKTVVCWGDNDDGQLGDGTEHHRSQPVAVEGLSDVVAISAGDDFTCAVTGVGKVFCWGDNGDGQLGDGTFQDRRTPVEVAGLANALTVATGDDHACAIDASGLVSCWGDNDHGQLGDGTDDDRPDAAPVKMP